MISRVGLGKNRRAKVLRLRVLFGRVLGVNVARGFARLCDLAEISKADVYDSKTNPKGTQRDLSPAHARDAYSYVKSEDLAFWPEVFLAVRIRSVVKVIKRDESSGDIVIDKEAVRNMPEVAISRVDGNHRLHFADGHHEGYPAIEREVSFCMALDLGLEEEIKLFRDINNNQRKMNTSHLDRIELRLTPDRVLMAKDLHLYLAKRLMNDSDSPFRGMVYDGGKKDVSRFIPLRTIKTGIEYMFSRSGKLPTIDDPDVQVKLIKNYLAAVKNWEPAAWRDPKKFLLLRGAGLWAVFFLGSEVIDRALARGKYKSSEQLSILKSGSQWNWGNDGDFRGLSGRAGALRIRDKIVADLADESGVSLRSLMKRISDDI